MSCDVALSAAIMLASFHSGSVARPMLELVAISAPAPAPVQNPLAREPLYAGIVSRATALKTRVEAYRAAAATAPLGGFDSFKTDIAALSDMDMQGHVDLAKRGTDGDLKCILRGISQDLPRKLAEVEAAKGDARAEALKDMFYLLRDNIEVITSPPTVTS